MAKIEPWSKDWKRVKPLASGSQGSTLLVCSNTSDRLAVLKTLHKRQNPKARRRLVQEVNNLRLLHNAGASVPELLDHNIDQLSNDAMPLFLVMEYFDGLTLDKYVDRNGSLSMDISIELVLSLLKTIQCAHSEGIYHRDIKPQNIMVQESPSLCTVLLDFGLSFHLESDFDVTADSEAVGNMFMVLPEQRMSYCQIQWMSMACQAAAFRIPSMK